MKKKSIEEIKLEKAFNKKDLIAYSIILLIILSLFIIFLPFGEKSNGFYLYVENEKVLTFKYDNTYTFDSDYKYKIDVDVFSNKITIYFDDNESEYNVISFDCTSKSVWVSESTCSVSKDCVYSPKITSKKGAIYCAPHKLKILPMGSNGKTDPIIG